MSESTVTVGCLELENMKIVSDSLKECHLVGRSVPLSQRLKIFLNFDIVGGGGLQ